MVHGVIIPHASVMGDTKEYETQWGLPSKYSKTIARVEKEMTMCLGDLESLPALGLA